MKHSEKLKIVLELLEVIEKIKTLIDNNDRQIAVIHFNSLEKRINTIQMVIPKTSVLFEVIDRIYGLHVNDLYEELEIFEKEGIKLTVGDTE